MEGIVFLGRELPWPPDVEYRFPLLAPDYGSSKKKIAWDVIRTRAEYLQ
jgi:hypothetical protein